MEFLVRGATQFGEPGVFMAFEETAAELAQNVRSLGFDLDELVGARSSSSTSCASSATRSRRPATTTSRGCSSASATRSTRSAPSASCSTRSRRCSAGLSNAAILRAELRRLFRWLKDKGVTAVITGERGDGTLTRHGLEEYVSDCVILLDHRVIDQVSTRRLRIVKYRGTAHGTNEYPFLIDEDGITVLPITSLGLEHEVSDERISTGVPRLDAMLGGEGYYRGSSVLVSGTAGSGKTSLAAHFAGAACARGERCLYFAFEESPGQIVRNMRSIGLDLEPWVQKGLLRFHAIRSQQDGLEMHLATFHKLVREFEPDVVVVDPIGSFIQAGTRKDATAMLTRLIDFLKARGTTAFLTSLTSGGEALEATDVDISSLIDTWLLLRDIELGGERNRALLHPEVARHGALQPDPRVPADRATASSSPTSTSAPDGVLTGSMRQAQEARERAERCARHAGDRGAQRETRAQARGAGGRGSPRCSASSRPRRKRRGASIEQQVAREARCCETTASGWRRAARPTCADGPQPRASAARKRR